ncbi:MAG: hypothetical protein MRY63_04935 [Neomegalonema sp.]|nr:hypothetical protein [Neomegalonema sp.]
MSADQTFPTTPRDALARLFDVVLDEADSNPAFAQRLMAAMGGEVTLAPAPKRRKKQIAVPEALAKADLRARRADQGEAALRAWLAGFTNAELSAHIRAERLSIEGVSKLPKNSLVNIIMRASR